MKGVLLISLSKAWLILFNANKNITQKMSTADGRKHEGKDLGFGVSLLLRLSSSFNERKMNR